MAEIPLLGFNFEEYYQFVRWRNTWEWHSLDQMELPKMQVWKLISQFGRQIPELGDSKEYVG